MAFAQVLRAITFYLEETFNVARDKGSLSLPTLYDINARAERNYWTDSKGRKWPLRDSL
jgi:hypothetical protein